MESLVSVKIKILIDGNDDNNRVMTIVQMTSLVR
jgi:hypothetical protein